MQQQKHRVTFDNKKAPFFTSVKASVDQYFKDNNIKPTGNLHLYIKTFVLISSFVALYVYLVFFTPSVPLALLSCCLLGLAMAGIGFNVMHDACHGSYSTKQWINDLLGLSINFLGSNAYIWKIKHNIIHHTYTNIDGVDEDIAKEPLIRHCETQKKKGFHKYQHIYVLPLYLITSLYWMLFTDFKKYFTGKIHTTAIQVTLKEHFIFWISKVFALTFYVAIPVYFVGLVPAIVGILVTHFALGLVLAIVFQLAHVVENVHFEEAINKSKKVENEWAVHQVLTTANFATDNKFITWFVGGLNFQIEHHLFPRVSHVHYPKINAIIREKCQEFAVPYNYYPTMGQAVKSHLRLLKQFGEAN